MCLGKGVRVSDELSMPSMLELDDGYSFILMYFAVCLMQL